MNLIKEVKSDFFKNKLFSLLSIKTKLGIIKYNKVLQNILNINKEDYKMYKSGRYKLGNLKGKVREFSLENNSLIFIGEYLEGKRNGEGKEFYNNGQNIFIGKFKNGMKVSGKGYKLDYEIENGSGYVREYYDDGQLKYEGEYLNGEKNGQGTEYYPFNNQNLFIGEYLNEKRWNGEIYDPFNDEIASEIINGTGKGKEFYTNGSLKYDGDYLNGEKNGNGKEYYYSGNLKYEGNYLNGKKDKNGKRKEYYDTMNQDIALKFDGEYLNGKKWNGYGKEFDNDGKLIFLGNYKNGEKEGYVFKFINGISLYSSELYLKGKPSGKFIVHSFSDIIYEGEYLNGKKNGKGKEYFKDGKVNRLIYEGNYLNGEKTGFGKLYIYEEDRNAFSKKDYIKRFEGEFKNGKIYGIGKEYHNDKLVYKGEFLNGERHGKGKEYSHSNYVYIGEFKNGKKNGEGKWYLFKKLSSEGNYLNGEIFGKEKCYLAGKLISEGEWKNGQREGKWVEYYYSDI